jgi:hypothetical protein
VSGTKGAMTTPDVRRNWESIRNELPSDYEWLAFETKAIKPQYANVQITKPDDLLRMIFLHVGAGLPLRQTVAWFAESGGPKVSAYCLHMRMRAAGAYLSALVARMTTWRAQCTPELWDGYSLLLVDATSFSGRVATGTDARIHAVLRLADLGVVQATALGVEDGETLRRFQWDARQLVIGDRAYCNPPGIAWAVDRHADVLVRLNRSALPLLNRRNEPFDVLQWVRPLREGQIVERAVRFVVKGDGDPRMIDGRVIATRLPQEKAEEARARVRKEQGHDLSAETLEMADYVVLFTTATLDAERCLEAYRLRWQIELLFKRWKSICGFDALPNERPDTIKSWLAAKLLLGLIVERLAARADGVNAPPCAA